MLKVLEKKLYPFLEARGFRKTFDAESTRDGDFCFFRTKDNINQFMSVQFDKYREAFVINIAEVPTGATIKVDGTEVLVTRYYHVLRVRARLQKGKGMLSWFRYNQRFTGSPRYQETADKVIRLFGEAEDWWSNKTFGPHLRNEDLLREFPALFPMLKKLKSKIRALFS